MRKLSQTEELVKILAGRARRHTLTPEQISRAMDEQEYDVSGLDALYAALEARGVTIYTAAHALSGAERGLSSKLGGFGPVEVAAHALRMIGRGVKVCVEIAMMTADAGLVELHEPIITIGGTGFGADTALVIRPAPTAEFLDSKVDRIICMPRKD